MDTRIYVMTHKKFTEVGDGLYRTLHVGHALSEDLGYPGDDTGEQISDKNKSYCELTGIYWMWKNVSCDIIGICHYRRYFIRNDHFILKQEVEETLTRCDIIVSASGTTEYGSLKEHYAKSHYLKDLENCREVIRESCPDYLTAFDLCMGANLFTLGNMMIARKEIFDEYCSWLFPILFETEKRIDISGYDAFQARVMGYLAERLLRVWLIHRKYKVREEQVLMIDPADRDNQVKAVQMKKECVRLILKDLIEQYKRGNYVDLVDSVPFPIDFQGKIPVWMCWWQGEEEMPELVRMCAESIRRNLSEEKYRLYLITMENVSEYVTFPQWVIDKFEGGKITMTALSDILRMGLLYRYGGLWIDATYFAAAPLNEGMFAADFFTLRMKRSPWKADVVQGRWAGNFLCGKAGGTLSRFVLNAFYLYWFTQDQQVDYYLIDYLIDAAYENIPEVREKIDRCPCTQPQVLNLQPRLNDVFKQEVYDELIKDTKLFKLSTKRETRKKLITGKKTFYGYLWNETFPDKK